MWSRLIIFLFTVTVCLIGKSNDYRFAHLTSANGISQSEVYSFLEDRNGFMWIGTLDGLNRYDGYSFEIFHTNKKNPHSLSNNTVRSLIEDRYGRIWIGTDNGLNFYDQRKELIYKIRINTSEDKFSIWQLLIVKDYLLIGTNDGLWRCSLKSNDVNEIEQSIYKVNKYCSKVISNTVIRRILPSENDEIYVQSDNSISKIVFQSDSLNPIILDDLPINYSSMVDMEVDTAGCIWIISYLNDILRYNPKTKTFQNITQGDNFLNNFSKKYKTISIDHSQRIWIGTIDQGLLYLNYDFKYGKIINAESVQNDLDNATIFNSNMIFTTYVSSTNKLWAGTTGTGVKILDPEFKRIQYFSLNHQVRTNYNPNFIRSVFVDNDNNILAGVQNNGLFKIDRKTRQTIKLGFGTESVYHISQYSSNIYLVCSVSGVSLVELKGKSLKILSTSNDYMSSAAFNVIQSLNGIYWAATYHGLICFSVKNNKIVFEGKCNKRSIPALLLNNCRVLCFDDINNQLFVGTEGGGLNCINLNDQGMPVDNKVYKMTDKPESLSNNYIRSIYQDKEKNFWIGTFEGLNKVIYNSITGKHTFKVYKKEDGLPNNMIESIVEDDNGYLWLGTNDGLSKFSPNQETFMNYNIDDGLQSKEFSEHAIFKTNKGEIIIGGINGINAFYPEDIKISKSKPKTLITDFFIDNKRIYSGQEIKGYIPLTNSILYTEKLELAPNLKNIGFKFTAMLFPNAGKVKYAYMLDGFDKEWIYTDALNRSVYYTNLKHGHYVFKVKATNTDGIWDENTKSLSIHIKTPFYLTWLAIIIYIIIFILLFIYFSHYSVINLTTKRNLLLEKEHNKRIIKLDEMRTRFFINISHDLRTPITLISEPLKDIINDKSISGKLLDNLQLIKRNAKRLSDLVEQLLDFRKAEESSLKTKLETLDFISFSKNEISHFSYAASKKGIELYVESTENEIITSIDPRMIAKVYFNIISNALKYTSTGSIRINIKRSIKNNPSDKYIQVDIIDTGIGLSKDQEKQIFDRFYQVGQNNESGYGIGLSHAKDLILAHNGSIEAESSQNGGAIIRFYIPEIVIDSKITSSYITNDYSYETNDIIIIEKDNNQKINPELKTILIVEDNMDILTYLKNSFAQYYNVLIALNGAEGLEIASKTMPDLIISDVMMPEMDGIEFCKVIKKNIVTSHIPVILLTAKVDFETKYKGIETGADDYIPKPFEIEYLKIRINNLLQSRENLRNLFQRSMVLKPTNVTVTTVDEKFLKKVMEIIEANLSDEALSINTLESELGLSHSTFYRKIKTLTGQSAQEFILNFRLKRAYQILTDDKNVRVSDVAYMVGFSNQNYFSRCFKEYFGFPPSDLKNIE